MLSFYYRFIIFYNHFIIESFYKKDIIFFFYCKDEMTYPIFPLDEDIEENIKEVAEKEETNEDSPYDQHSYSPSPSESQEYYFSSKEEDEFYRTYLFKPPKDNRSTSFSSHSYSSNHNLYNNHNVFNNHNVHNVSNVSNVHNVFGKEKKGSKVFNFSSSAPSRLMGNRNTMNERKEELEDEYGMTESDGLWQSILGDTVRKHVSHRKFIPKKILQLVSRHPYTPLSMLEEFPHLRWEFSSFEIHPLMTTSFIYSYQSKYRRRVFFRSSPSYKDVPSTPFLSFSIKENIENIEKKDMSTEERKQLSKSISLPLAYVLHHPHKSWDYPFLLLYREWTVQQIDELLNTYRIPWKLFSKNYFLSFDILYEHLDKPWDWKVLAMHPRFPPQLILDDFILFPRWNWKHAYKNPRMTVDCWNYLRKGYRQPFHSSWLFANFFQYSEDLRMASFLLLQKWISFHLHRQRFKRKLRFLLSIYHHLPPDLFGAVIMFL